MSALLAEVGPEAVYGLPGGYFADSGQFAQIQEQVMRSAPGHALLRVAI